LASFDLGFLQENRSERSIARQEEKAPKLLALRAATQIVEANGCKSAYLV